MRLVSALLTLATLTAPFAFAQTPAPGVQAPAVQAPAVQAPAVQAPAAQAPAPPPCNGFPATVRVSEIKPGAMPDFMKAVAAHQAWYSAHGSNDLIFASRIYVRDPATHASSFSETEILSFHVSIPPDNKLPEDDDAWKAFVKMYQDTSTIKTTYRVCLPKPLSQ